MTQTVSKSGISFKIQSPRLILTRRFLLAMVYLSNVSCYVGKIFNSQNFPQSRQVSCPVPSRLVCFFFGFLQSYSINTCCKTIFLGFPVRSRLTKQVKRGRGFPVKRLYKFGGQLVLLIVNCSSNRTTIYTGFVCWISSTRLQQSTLRISSCKRENVFLQGIVPKSGVFCHGWNNHGHIFKNIGMAKESEPARRTW